MNSVCIRLLTTVVVIAGMGWGLTTSPHAQGPNTCKNASVQVITSSTYRFATESPDHNATVPGQPTNFLVTGYRNKWVVDVPPQNPLARPVVQMVEVPRAQMTLVPDSDPACYLSPVMPITPMPTANVPARTNLRSWVVGLTDGLGTSAKEGFQSDISTTFQWGPLRGGAHSVLGPS